MLTVDQLDMFGDRILIDPDPKHEESEGGLVIPQTVLAGNPNYFNMTGVVLKLGDGIRRHEYECINCQVSTPMNDGPCPGCHQPLGNSNARVAETDLERHPFDVQVGERVMFGRFAGKQVELLTPSGDTKRFLIMRESEVLGIVEGEHRITPGYKAPKWGRVSNGLTV
jgi:co-chaperonin GroES (HSP10)